MLLAQIIPSGITAGAVYALVALGFGLIYKGTHSFVFVVTIRTFVVAGSGHFALVGSTVIGPRGNSL